MSVIETQVAKAAAVTWSTANQECLRTGLARLRLLIERRATRQFNKNDSILKQAERLIFDGQTPRKSAVRADSFNTPFEHLTELFKE